MSQKSLANVCFTEQRRRHVETGWEGFAEREIVEYRARGEDHSPLMPAARITLPHQPGACGPPRL